MSITRKSLADTIDAYDDEIAALQASKRETFQAYREQLADFMGKDDVKVEISVVSTASFAVEQRDDTWTELLAWKRVALKDQQLAVFSV